MDPILLKKVVEIDNNNDSTVTAVIYNSSNQMSTINVDMYENGQKIALLETFCSYNSRGFLTYLIGRRKNLLTNAISRFDQGTYISENKITGYWFKDSAESEIHYHKYIYGKYDVLTHHFGDVDSSDFFSSNIKHYKYLDSMIYDNSFLKEYYTLSHNQLTEVNELVAGQKMGYSYIVRNFMPLWVDGYTIFGVPWLINDLNPSSINGENFTGGTKSDYVICNIKIDAKHRAIKMDYLSSNNNGVVQNSLFHSYIKTRLIDYYD